jgi:hypothetical protein
MSDVHVDTFLESRDVTFFENIFPMKKLYVMSSLPINVIADTTPEPSNFFIMLNIHLYQSMRSKRPGDAKSFCDNFTIYFVDDTIPSQRVVPCWPGSSPTRLMPSHPRPRHDSIMEQGVSCRPARLDARPKHSSVSITRAVLCIRLVRPAPKPGYVFFSSNFVF